MRFAPSTDTALRFDATVCDTAVVSESDEGSVNLSRNVQSAREARKWSQRQLAEKLERLGVSVSQAGIARLERGEREPGLSELRGLAKLFDVTIDTLAGPSAEFAELAKWQRVRGGFDYAQALLVAATKEYEASRVRLLVYLHDNGDLPLDQHVVDRVRETAGKSSRSIVNQWAIKVEQDEGGTWLDFPNDVAEKAYSDMGLVNVVEEEEDPSRDFTLAAKEAPGWREETDQ